MTPTTSDGPLGGVKPDASYAEYLRWKAEEEAAPHDPRYTIWFIRFGIVAILFLIGLTIYLMWMCE
jgi:hypothetical protein